MFEKSQILRVTPHQHINLKQSLKIEIHKSWVSNMHKICGSQNYIEIVIINSSRYYNMFSYINLGFYQTWDEFLRELPLIHKSQIFIFVKLYKGKVAGFLSSLNDFSVRHMPIVFPYLH